jgi:DNA mismatch repair protein MutS2
VEFDVETLRPTYRLLMGIPGKSNAFQIAEKLGLDGAIIERANSFLTADEQQVADLISGLEEHKLQAEQASREADLRLAEVVEQQRQLKNQELELANKETEIITKARLQAAEIVKESRREAEELYQQMKQELKNAGVHNKEVQATRSKMQKLQEKLQTNLPAKKYQGDAPAKVSVGQSVEIPKLRQSGIVCSLPNEKGELQVQIGVMKVGVLLSDLRIDKQKVQKERTASTRHVLQEKSRTISTEIDLHGLTVEEAIYELDKYLDDAFLANLHQVRVIHGRGTGALKAGVLPYLKNHRLVASIKGADYNEGGLGVTVVELK